MKLWWSVLLLLAATALVQPLQAATGEERRLYRVAQATFDDKLYDVAERQLSEFLQKFPASDRAEQMQLMLGQAQLYQDKWADAVKTLQEAVTRWPDKHSDGFRFWLAEALARGEKFAEAEGRYREVVDQVAASAYQAQAVYGLAFVLFKQGKFDAADETVNRLGKLSPKGELAQEGALLRGQIHLAAKRFEDADVVFEDLLKKAPNTRLFYRAQFWLAESLARRKQFDAALTHQAVIIDAFKSKTNRLVDAQLVAEAWYATGWIDWQTEKFAEAADAYASALANAPTTSLKRDALLKLGEALVRSGKLPAGVARLREFLQLHPADPIADEVQMAIADLFFQHRDYVAAIPEYASLIAGYPQSKLVAKANFNAGSCGWQLAANDTTGVRLSEALKFFQQAAKLSKDRALISAALFKVADAQFTLGQFAEAVTAYQQLINHQPDLPEMDRVLFQLGQAKQRARDAAGAAETLETLVRQFPNSPLAPEAQYEVAQIQIGLGHEAAARTALAAVLSQFAKSDWAKKAALGIGESFQREGQYEAAVAEFEKLMTAEPNTDLALRAFYNRGWCLAQKGQATNTLAEFTGFLKNKPATVLAADVQFWIAEYYLRQKDYLKAQEQFQALAAAYPTSKLADSAQYMAGRAAYARQDYKAAIELYEGVLKTFTNSTLRCDARFGEGDALSELGQFGDALLVFEALVKEFPDSPLACEAHGRKGDCQYTLNRYEDAITSYRKALDCAHDATMRNQALFKIGQSFEKLTKLDDAIQYYTRPLYETAVTPDPNEPPERFWAGKAGRAAASLKEQQQKWQDAITLYQKLAETCPELKTMAEERIRKIRVERVILF